MADTQQAKGGALAKFMAGGAVAALDPSAQARALLESAQTGSTGSGDVSYLSFSGKTGRYQLGRDKVAPDPDAVYIVDPDSFVEGWICWVNSAPKEKHEWSVYDRATAAIPASRLTDHGPYAEGDGWDFLMGFSMLDADDPAGQQIKFTISSKSGRNVFADLNKEVAVRLPSGEPHVPVITLGAGTFTAQGKKNSKPVINYIGWVTPAEVMTFLDMGEDGDLDDLLAGVYLPEPEEPEEPEESEESEEAHSEPAPAKRQRRARREA